MTRRSAIRSAADRPTALFERGGKKFIPTAATLGPWGPNTLHGGPVCGLLAHGILRHRHDEELHLARLTVDVPRAVPASELTLHTSVVRSGRRIVVVEARLTASGDTVARAVGLMLHRSDEPIGAHRQTESTISAFDAAVPAALPERPLHHANCIGLRRGTNGAYWVNVDLELVEGTALHPYERAAVVADWANPSANMTNDGIGYINADIALYLHRQPQGTWLGVGPSLRSSADGVAISDCPLTDAHGVTGRCLTTSLAAGSTTRAPGLSPTRGLRT